jgi:hypothetical protein
VSEKEPDAITTGRFPPFIKSKNKVGQRPFISLHNAITTTPKL